MKRRFESHVRSAGKFWEVELLDCAGVWQVDTTYGKIGTNGALTTNKFGRNKKLATAYINTKVREKLSKGYVEVQVVAPLMLPGLPPPLLTGTRIAIQANMAQAADYIKNSMPVAVGGEVIITVIVGNEVIQESRK